MAVEINSGGFRDWNNDLYAMIKSEMETIQGEGYNVILIGDFNRHVSNDSQGVPNNRADINCNGQMIWSFIEANNMVLVNAKRDIHMLGGIYLVYIKLS